MSRLISALYAALLQIAARGELDDRAVAEAAATFDDRRRAAWRRSPLAWCAMWMREVRALAAVRRDCRAPGGGWRAVRFLDHLARDVVFGARQLVRQPVFTGVAVSSVACGLAGAIIVFAAANAVLWRPLVGVADPGRVVSLYYGDGNATVWSYPDFEDARRDMPALDDAAAFTVTPMTVAAGDAPPREVMAARVGDNYFRVLGVPLVIGRAFGPGDPADVAVLGARTWAREYGGDPAVVGRTVEVRGRPHTIVGVAPERLLSLTAPVAPQVYVPITGEDRTSRGARSLDVVGRLADGATIDEARAQAEVAARRLYDADPRLHDTDDGRVRPILVTPARHGRVPPQGRPTVLGGVAGALVVTGLILLVATTNLANMVLSQGLRRRPEFHVRRALGAGRRRLVAQLVTESLIIAALAGGVALLGVQMLARWLAAGAIFAAVPAGIDLAPDWRVVVFAIGVTAAAGVAVGLLPALHVTRSAPVGALHRGMPMRPRRRFSLRTVLVTAQLATSLVLVVVALLAARSLREAHRVDPGFDADGVTVMRVNLGDRQMEPAAAAPVFAELLARAEALPGVEQAALARLVPLGGSRIREVGIEIEDYQPPERAPAAMAVNYVSPGYFALMRMPLVAGRDFDGVDTADGLPVAVVNRALVEVYWPDGRAIGRRVGGREVVGVVADSMSESLSGPVMPFAWYPTAQIEDGDFTLHVRAAGDPGQVADALERVAADVAPGLVTQAAPMRDAMAGVFLLPRILSIVFGAAGALALSLAAIGVYGVMSFVVGSRTREMGIRLALGESPARLTRLVMREGLTLSLFGFGVGLLLAAAATSVLRSKLVGIAAFDPVPIAGGVALLASAAALACYLPARRAAQVDPVESLRVE